MIKRSELKEALKICASGCCGDGCIFSEIAGANGGLEDRNCASYMAEAALDIFFPQKESMKKLPCICGSKRRELWENWQVKQFRCQRCGIWGYQGRTELEAVIGWNRKIMDLLNGEDANEKE